MTANQVPTRSRSLVLAVRLGTQSHGKNLSTALGNDLKPHWLVPGLLHGCHSTIGFAGNALRRSMVPLVGSVISAVTNAVLVVPEHLLRGDSRWLSHSTRPSGWARRQRRHQANLLQGVPVRGVVDAFHCYERQHAPTVRTHALNYGNLLPVARLDLLRLPPRSAP